jgi:hypothetical protein
MTAAVLERPDARCDEAPGARAARPPTGGRLTLEGVLSATLQEARANGSAECPVCHARMTREADAARCGGCGSRLS